MNSSPTSIESTASVYRERLQQAKRVMQSLSSREGVKFNISVYARHSEHGLEACVAGLCGLDPWFQERGFVTDVGVLSIGTTSMSPEDFFGTSRPFYPGNYYHHPVTNENAISALDHAIERIDLQLRELNHHARSSLSDISETQHTPSPSLT